MVKEFGKPAEIPEGITLDDAAALEFIHELCKIHSRTQRSSSIYSRIDALHEQYGDASIDVLVDTARQMLSSNAQMIDEAEDPEKWRQFKLVEIRNVVLRHRKDAGTINEKGGVKRSDLRKTLSEKRREVRSARSLQPDLAIVISSLEGVQRMYRERQSIAALVEHSRETLRRGDSVLAVVCRESGINVEELKEEAAQKKRPA